jgi:hypothetical protein
MDQLLEYIRYFSFTFAGGVLGYFIRIFIDHRLAIGRLKENIRITETNKASSALRAAFAPALAFIYLAKKHGSTHEVPDVDKFLKGALLSQAAEIEIFRPFVPKSDRTEYQEEWEKYRYEVWNYGFDANSMNDEVNPHNVYREKIHNILNYAIIE